MPVKQGGRLVELNPEIVRAFDKVLEDGKRTEPDFTKLINAVLEDILAKEEFLKHYLPNLDAIAVKGNSVYIQDIKSRKVYEVAVDEKVAANEKIICYEDKSDQCDHARYAMGMTQFGKLVRLRKNLQTVMRVNSEEYKTRHSQNKGDGSDPESIFEILRMLDPNSGHPRLTSFGSFQISKHRIPLNVEPLNRGS